MPFFLIAQWTLPPLSLDSSMWNWKFVWFLFIIIIYYKNSWMVRHLILQCLIWSTLFANVPFTGQQVHKAPNNLNFRMINRYQLFPFDYLSLACTFTTFWSGSFAVYHMMHNARKGSLCNLPTMQTQISLWISTGWSGPSLAAYKINGYCSICGQTENAQTRLHECTS